MIKGGYLDGEPTGQYDSATIEAMKDFQSANGFSATGQPSAPALKKLGVARNSGDGYSVPINKAVDSDLRPANPVETPGAKPAKPPTQQPTAKGINNRASASTGSAANEASRPRVVESAPKSGGKPPAKPDERKPHVNQ